MTCPESSRARVKVGTTVVTPGERLVRQNGEQARAGEEKDDRVSLTERVDRFQRRHPATGLPLAVIYKFVDDQGAYLAALCAYYAFISLFPLLLLFATVLGIVLADNPDLQDRILDSAMSQIPVIGGQLGEPEKLSGGATAIIIGGIYCFNIFSKF